MNTLDKVYDLTIDIKNIDVKYNSYAKFFDDDRETSVIRIKLLNDKTPMNLENCIVEAYFILADNTYHNEACKIINSSEGVVELQLCQKCLVKGENIVRLSILKDNEISNTPVITYEVRKGLYSDDPSFNDDPLTPILSQMLLDIKVTKVNQIELQERYEKSLPKIEGKIKEVESLINRVDTAIASGTQDLEVKEARVGENGKSYAKLGDRLDNFDSQLEQKANGNEVVKKGYGTLNDFDEPTRKAILENNSIDINYVLGEGNVGLENTNYIEVERYNYLDKSILDTDGFIGADGNIVSYANVKTSKKYVKLKPNTTYSTNANWNGGLYNKNLVFTRQIDAYNMTFTTTEEEVYARFSFSYEEGNELTNYYWAMLVEGSKTLAKEDYIDYHVIKKAIPSNTAYINMIENIIKEVISDTLSASSKWNGKIWNCLGDSITYGYASSETYHKIIGEEKGFSLVRNYGISGSTIAYIDNELAINPPNGSPMCNRFNEMDDNADLISVMALTNDVGWRVPLGTMEDRTDRTFYGACHILFKGLSDKYWDKAIFAMTSTPRNSDVVDNTLEMLPYVKAFKEVCQYYSIPCLDLFSISGFKVNNENFKTKYMPDGLHPNAEGYKLLANIIGNFIEQL